MSKKARWLFVMGGMFLFAVMMSAFAEAQTTDAAAGVASKEMVSNLWYITPIGAVLALIFAFYFYKNVMKNPEGDPEMAEIAASVKSGAYAYLKRQYKVVGIVFIILSGVFAFLAYVLHVQNPFVPFAFLTGGFFSGLAGFFGMKMATSASSRTAAGARNSLNEGLRIAFRSGAVMGLTVVGLGLIDIALWYLVLQYLYDNGLVNVTGYTAFNPDWVNGVSSIAHEWQRAKMVDMTTTMLTFGMGASTQALFARVGGGIYTKAADVGADLVGKVEAGIPEDDPRNPATIADNVGDNVGDVAGMGADLYESYCGSILATAALGAAAYPMFEALAPGTGLAAILAPMIVAGIGNILSIMGIFIVRTKEGATQKNLLAALGRGVNLSTVMIIIAVGLLTYFLLPHKAMEGGTIPLNWGIFGSVVTGLLAGWIIGKSTEYYTSDEYKPTQGIAANCETGPATTIIDGIATGMYSTWIPVITVCVATLVAFGLPGGFINPAVGLYGVGIAAVGMLSTLGITLATDAYGPIADNAGGNAEMTGQKPEVRQRTDALDALGNTTAATGKGFAIGSAALTALALLAAYIGEVGIYNKKDMTETGHVAIVQRQRDKVSGNKYFFIFTDNSEKGKIVNDYASQARAKYVQAKAEYEISKQTKEDEDKLRAALESANATLIADVKTESAKLFKKDSKGESTKESAEALNLTKEDANKLILSTGIANIDDARMADFMTAYEINLMNPKLLVGLFLGAMLAFVFCAMTMKAVGRAAKSMVEEVRRQFKTKPRIMEYKLGIKDFPEEDKPDYARCVEISTAGAQREMLVPSLMAIIVPILAGLILGVPGVMGLLAGGLTSGFLLAVFMANAGGAWDNAKKYIEKGKYGGKGSSAHKAAVVGDTVGDPFKDTSGPALNILIKLMSMVSVVVAGVIVAYSDVIGTLLGIR